MMAERFGRTTLVTDRLDWTPAQVAVAYNGQQHVERVFRVSWTLRCAVGAVALERAAP